MDNEKENIELDGFARGTLSIVSEALTGNCIGEVLGTDVEYIQNKGDWARNPKTGRKIRRYENSFWCKYFEDRDGDSFDESLDDVINYLKEYNKKINHLKKLDRDIKLAIELVIKKGDFHIGNVFSKEQIDYISENKIEFGLSIYQMISDKDYG